MNRITLTASILLACLAVNAVAQKKPGMTHMIYNDSTALCFQNNYITNLDVNYQPYDIRLPYGELHYEVYGSQLDILAIRMAEVRNGGFSLSGSFRDTLPQDAHVFNLATMEFCFKRNGTTEADWLKVVNATPHTDIHTERMQGLPKTTYHRKALLLHRVFLQNGDSATLMLRHTGKAPFLTVHFKKLDALLSPPRLMYSKANDQGNVSLEEFIKDVLSDGGWPHGAGPDADSFYDDWPGNSAGSSARLFEETKAAYVFRERKDLPNDSAFEYRLLANGDRRVKWKKTNNIIFVSGLKAGNQYQLEVRYADKPRYVFVKKFFVPPYWYQQNWFKAALAAALLLVGGMIYLLYHVRRQKKQRAAQLARTKTLYMQLNPHFIFNALGSIQGLLNEGEIEKANIYLSGFGSLLRNTLDSHEKSFTTLQEDLQQLQRYIHLEQLRRPFSFHITVADGLQPSAIEMLPMLFQPLVENAIGHGYRGKDQPLMISLAIYAEQNNLIVHFTDNGKGFDTAQPRHGKGLRLTYERITLFNQAHKGKKIVPELKSDTSGTSFLFKFINWLDD